MDREQLEADIVKAMMPFIRDYANEIGDPSLEVLGEIQYLASLKVRSIFDCVDKEIPVKK